MCIYKRKWIRVVITIYVNDIIRTPKEFKKAADCLKQEFEMKDLRRIKFFLGFSN